MDYVSFYRVIVGEFGVETRNVFLVWFGYGMFLLI